MVRIECGYREDVARLVAATAALFLLTAAGAGATGGVRVDVTPAVGSPSTAFTISYVAPARTGVVGTLRLRDEVTATNPATASGCDASLLQPAPDAQRGRHMRVVLRPAAGRTWCTGRFKGKLLALQTPVCPPRSLCPQWQRLRVLGTFSFAVRPF
jgi:hypothetical protein